MLTEQKKVYIMSGIPGSGKSTRAKQLMANNNRSFCCSADDFFIDHQTGEYDFDRELLPDAHQHCRNMFENAIEASSNDIVIVDNTNITLFEIDYYVKLALYACADVTIECFVAENFDHVRKCHKRNVHGVPLGLMASMAISHEYKLFKQTYDVNIVLHPIERSETRIIKSGVEGPGLFVNNHDCFALRRDLDSFSRHLQHAYYDKTEHWKSFLDLLESTNNADNPHLN